MQEKINYSGQELFNQVAKHLLIQNKQSFFKNTGIGAYRGDQDLKCGLGIIIPDEEYSEELEFRSPSEWHWSIQQKFGLGEVEVLKLADELQGIHDNYEPKEWPTALLELAESKMLDSSVITKTLKEKGNDNV